MGTKRSKKSHSHLDGSDGLVAGGALGREDPVKVVDAVDLVVEVDGEGDAVEALVAHAAPEAAGVVRLAHRLQDLGREDTGLERDSWDGIESLGYHFHDQMPAHSALLGGLLESGILQVGHFPLYNRNRPQPERVFLCTRTM